jgi:hypothetical protein
MPNWSVEAIGIWAANTYALSETAADAASRVGQYDLNWPDVT